MQLAWRTRLAHRQREPREIDRAASADSSGPTRDDAADDLAIVVAAKADPRAFAPLYQRYAALILGYCQRQLGNRELAADATAQTFTKAIAALSRFEPDPSRSGSTVRSWLFTIAHNVVVDLQRRNRAHLSLDNEPTALWLDSTPYVTDPSPSPEALLIESEDTRRVRTMLARLPDRQRQIVELRLLGLNGIEIAETIGMSHSAVKSAQFRAYGTLRDLLREDADDSNRSTITPETDDAHS